MKFINKVILRNRIFIERFSGVCVLQPHRAIELGITGPVLRACGIPRDLRRDNPYLIYNELDFDVITENDCDNYARALLRIREIEESHKIIAQIIDKMPQGDIRNQNIKTTFAAKKNIYSKMEELISDFSLVNQGTPIPAGETYTAVEGAKGELGFFIVSKGDGHP
jgi:NADH-quinone oxidoreductase subunit D